MRLTLLCAAIVLCGVVGWTWVLTHTVQTAAFLLNLTL